MIVMLTNCDKDSAAKVQRRLEGVVGKYLADQNANGAIRVDYGHAAYPYDAKDGMGLIEKARSSSIVSRIS
ncbi:MAG: hypothetical protein Q7S30_03815, partial [Candidatus Omnitrophota bacterium]|nr:hypothetical protein [Candidatus Omnitrophota bacterium]